MPPNNRVFWSAGVPNSSSCWSCDGRQFVSRGGADGGVIQQSPFLPVFVLRGVKGNNDACYMMLERNNTKKRKQKKDRKGEERREVEPRAVEKTVSHQGGRAMEKEVGQPETGAGAIKKEARAKQRATRQTSQTGGGGEIETREKRDEITMKRRLEPARCKRRWEQEGGRRKKVGWRGPTLRSERASEQAWDGVW